MPETVPQETSAERKERLRRRLIAARALAGLTVPQLADRLKELGHERGYSARTLGAMERGETPILPQAFAVLADACDLTPAFFTVDFATLGESPIDAAIEDRLERIVSELRAEQIERANLERALQELLGADLRTALAAARAQ